MTEPNPEREEVDKFIQDQIDSVPQLEALILLRNSRPKEWSVQQMAKALYVSPELAQKTLDELVQRRLISETSQTQCFYYQPGSEEKEHLLDSLDAIYRSEIVRVSTMIHSKASQGVREFARAFRFTKEKDKE